MLYKLQLSHEGQGSWESGRLGSEELGFGKLELGG